MKTTRDRKRWMDRSRRMSQLGRCASKPYDVEVDWAEWFPFGVDPTRFTPGAVVNISGMGPSRDGRYRVVDVFSDRVTLRRG